jgi:carboxylesterase
MSVDAGPFSLGPVGGSGPAVVCLHGLTGTPYEVRPPAEALAAAGFACVGPLLPGHLAPVDQLAATSSADWIAAALAAFDRLRETHERVYVLGLSLGGLLALSVGAHRPVAGLLILATPLSLRPLPRIAVPLLARFVQSVPKNPGIADPEALARHPGTERMPLPSVVQLMAFQREVERDLPMVEAPLHLIYSRKDPTVDPRSAQRILELAGSSRKTLHFLERSLHVITVDLERDEVARQCVAFLGDLESGVGSSACVDAGPAAP